MVMFQPEKKQKKEETKNEQIKRSPLCSLPPQVFKGRFWRTKMQTFSEFQKGLPKVVPQQLVRHPSPTRLVETRVICLKWLMKQQQRGRHQTPSPMPACWHWHPWPCSHRRHCHHPPTPSGYSVLGLPCALESSPLTIATAEWHMVLQKGMEYQGVWSLKWGSRKEHFGKSSSVWTINVRWTALVITIINSKQLCSTESQVNHLKSFEDWS